MDAVGLRRVGWGVMRVAIVCLTPFRRFVSLGRWREVVKKIGAGSSGHGLRSFGHVNVEMLLRLAIIPGKSEMETETIKL